MKQHAYLVIIQCLHKFNAPLLEREREREREREILSPFENSKNRIELTMQSQVSKVPWVALAASRSFTKQDCKITCKTK